MPHTQTSFWLMTDRSSHLPFAFLPVADVVSTYESIATQFLQDELPLLLYFEKTWIGTPVAGNRRLNPEFPLQMWNVLDRASTGSTRTTNALEAFHHSFNSLISCQHPSIFKLLDGLKSQQSLSNNTMQRVARGCTFKPNKMQEGRNTRIQALIAGYNRADAARFLRGIALNYID